jgi:hypothetical protein
MRNEAVRLPSLFDGLPDLGLGQHLLVSPPNMLRLELTSKTSNSKDCPCEKKRYGRQNGSTAYVTLARDSFTRIWSSFRLQIFERLMMRRVRKHERSWCGRWACPMGVGQVGSDQSSISREDLSSRFGKVCSSCWTCSKASCFDWYLAGDRGCIE